MIVDQFAQNVTAQFVSGAKTQPRTVLNVILISVI
jgi:hypothetical protein